MPPRPAYIEPHMVQSNGFAHWRRSHPRYGSLRPFKSEHHEIHLGLQETLSVWYAKAGGFGFPLDHPRVTFDSALRREVFLLEPNVHGGGRPRCEAVARSRLAMAAVSALSGLDIVCLDIGFYSDFTLAFLLPVPTAAEMAHLKQLARDRDTARHHAA